MSRARVPLFCLALLGTAACADGPMAGSEGGAPEAGSATAQRVPELAALLQDAEGSAPAWSEGAWRVRSLEPRAAPSWEGSPANLAPTARRVNVDVQSNGEVLAVASERDGFAITLRRLGQPMPPRGVEGAALGLGAADRGAGAPEALVFAREAGVEDLLVVRDPSQPLGYDVELPSGWRLDHDSRRVVEIVDPLGTPRLRIVAQKAWDADGRALPISLRVDASSHVEIEVDAEGATLPLFVDPEVQDTGTLAFARSRNTMTLTLDGRALVIGGSASEDLPIEAFDPSTSRFDVLGPELPARERHSAVVLRDGRLAIIGGRRHPDGGIDEALGTIDLVDPMTGTITESVPLADARAFHTSTRLPDGRVLVAGGEGYDAAGEPSGLASTELFDPETGVASPGPSLSEVRSGLTATLLEDGRVFVAGGGDTAAPVNGVPASKTAELFDPVTDAWSPVPSEMAQARRLHAATLLHDGRVMISGGTSLLQGPVFGDYFDPSSGAFTGASWATSGYYSWSDQPPLQLLPSGQRFNSGNWSEPDTEPGTGCQICSTSPTTLLHDGSVLYVRGSTAYRGLAETTLASAGYGMPARGEHAATLLPSGRVLLTGGRYVIHQQFQTNYDRVEAAELDPIQGTATDTASLARPRYRHTATLLPNGKVLVAGGASSTGGDVRVTELYDPITKTFTDGAALQVDRDGHTATPLPNGDVLIVGGTDESLVERYVALAGHFEKAGDLATARRGHTATLLRDGHVLIAGGGTAQLELYDPSDSSFEPAGTMLRKRSGHAAALLPDGRVLLVAGVVIADLVAEIWDPATRTSVAIPLDPPWPPDALIIGAPATATTLWNGDIFIAGISVLNNSVAFRPSQGKFVPAPTAAYVGRMGNTATRLLDGGVLLAGWYSGQEEGPENSFVRVWDPSALQAKAPFVSSYPPAVVAGGQASLGGARFAGHSETSSGHTLASSVNHPIALWLPMAEGTPSLGTLVDFDQENATWRVPTSAFSGLGSLIVTTAGLRSGGVPVLVARAALATPCNTGSACDSGVCSDGVCCDGECGPCSACTAAKKGAGVDGVCGPLPLDAPPSDASACPAEPLSTCGRTGVCDGAGECGVFAEGTKCLAGAVCTNGACAVEPARCDGSAIRQGETVVKECAPYACTDEPACRKECTSALDCAPEHVCNPDGHCEGAPDETATPPESGCAVRPSPSRGDAGGAWLLLAVVAIARRRLARALAFGTALLAGGACSSSPPTDGQGGAGGGTVAPSAGGDGQGGMPPAPPPECGNGVLEPGEACDGDDVGANTCTALGFTGGAPRCRYDCTLDATACAGCGNGYVDPGEECDGDAIGEATCLSRAPQAWLDHLVDISGGAVDDPNALTTGAPACTTACKLDLSGCGYCYDGVLNGTELCDDYDEYYRPTPPVLGGATCQSVNPNLAGDGLGCLYCRNYLPHACERPAPPGCIAGQSCSLVLGTKSTLIVPADPEFDLAAGSLTLEYWGRIDDPGECRFGVGGLHFDPLDFYDSIAEWGLGHGPTWDGFLLSPRQAPNAGTAGLYVYDVLQQHQWFHVAGVIDVPAGQLRTYVDGALEGTKPFTLAPPLGGLEPVWLGSRCEPSWPLFQRGWGRMDELRISRGARYTGNFAPSKVFTPDATTLALYHFDEGTGDVVLDASGHGRHAQTVVGIGSEPPTWAGEHP